jgi:hypothetical protein
VVRLHVARCKVSIPSVHANQTQSLHRPAHLAQTNQTRASALSILTVAGLSLARWPGLLELRNQTRPWYLGFLVATALSMLIKKVGYYWLGLETNERWIITGHTIATRSVTATEKPAAETQVERIRFSSPSLPGNSERIGTRVSSEMWLHGPSRYSSSKATTG